MRRFASAGRGGGGGTQGWRVELTVLHLCRGKENGGGAGVSSKDEAIEDAVVVKVEEGGGRPGPHPKPNKG